LKLESKAAHATITVFLTYLGSMDPACCLQSGTLLYFSALLLFDADGKGIQPVKVLPEHFPRVYFGDRPNLE